MLPPGGSGAEQVTLSFPHNSNVSGAEWANFQPHKAAKRKNKMVQGGASGQYSVSAGIVLAGPTPSSAATR